MIAEERWRPNQVRIFTDFSRVGVVYSVSVNIPLKNK